jgi:hypothetical protein
VLDQDPALPGSYQRDSRAQGDETIQDLKFKIPRGGDAPQARDSRAQGDETIQDLKFKIPDGKQESED